MDSTPALPPQIIEALARGWTVLTANQRAARTLRHAFDLRQRALGNSHWQPPSILAWDTWLASHWHRLLLEGHASELLLNATQEHTLWRAVIERTAETAQPPPDRRPRRDSPPMPGFACTPTAAASPASISGQRRHPRLRPLGRRIRAPLRPRPLPHPGQLPEGLRTAFAAGELTAAFRCRFLLVGFDSKTPAQTALLEAIRATGA